MSRNLLLRRVGLRRRPARLAFLLALVTVTGSALAQTAGNERHTSSDIFQNTVWDGDITLTREVRIHESVLRVEPGTHIRLVASPTARSGPLIHLSGTPLDARHPRREARLILDGTPDDPIVIETPEGRAPGGIQASPMTGCSIVARHVVFRRLGLPLAGNRAEPAIFLALSAPENDLWLADCRFESCGPVHAEFIGDGATADISRCTFQHGAGENAVELVGTSPGIRVVADNLSDTGFRADCSNLLLTRNILIGERAALTVGFEAATAIRIDGNYVHCTTGIDNGRYALRCRSTDPDVAASGNVLRGGTYVIESAPGRVVGNVLIGAAGLQPAFPGLDVQRLDTTTSTHYLVSHVPPHTTIAGNLLLGPAYAAVALGGGSAGVTIAHNLFDGWESARWAVQFNVLGQFADVQPLGAVVERNVFTRYRAAPLTDRIGATGTLARAEDNLFAQVPEPFFERLPNAAPPPDGWVLPSLADLRLQAPAATQAALTIDDQLLLRRIEIAQVREMWFDSYMPRPDSPLRCAGTIIGPAGYKAGTTAPNP
jgi:hypothetical protein